jgi:hypothetical protein
MVTETVELSIGVNRTTVRCASEQEKDLFLKAARELNGEYNRLIINCGNVEENILLFFLLLKMEIKLRHVTFLNVDETFPGILKSISKYVLDKNVSKLKESLMLIMLVRKLELDQGDKKVFGDDTVLTQLIKKFGEEIRGNIKALENNILLS